MSNALAARRDRRDRRRAQVMLVLAVALFVVGAGCAAAAFVVRADTADLRASAGPINRRVRELTASEHDAERRLALLRSRGRATTSSLAALLAAYQAQVEASNHAVDVANQAVDQYNSGQAPIVAAFQGAGDAAITTVEERTAEVHAAFSAAQTAMTQLMASDG
jgi:hypothetical protein